MAQPNDIGTLAWELVEDGAATQISLTAQSSRDMSEKSASAQVLHLSAQGFYATSQFSWLLKKALFSGPQTMAVSWSSSHYFQHIIKTPSQQRDLY